MGYADLGLYDYAEQGNGGVEIKVLLHASRQLGSVT